MSALTVLRMMSKVPLAAFIASSSFEAMCAVAPRPMASAAFASLREMVVTVAPIAAAILTPMWPRPPTPTMATCLPVPAPQRCSGE